MTLPDAIEISGAGPAGLAAAITISKLGHKARIYERRADVGFRFHGDFQGLENWTAEVDVLEEIAALRVEPEFDHKAYREVVVFNASGVDRIYRANQPLFYLVTRGNSTGTLDSALKQQALAAGVEICFGSPATHFPEGGIVTEGPHRADAIAAGYLFDTDMADGAYAVLSDALAPKGYAYLLVCNGRGTLASCLFDDFHHEHAYVERCRTFFEEHVGVRMQNPRRFGGSGNFSLPKRAHKGGILYAGEAAGFQDPLFGFGMRWALLSGAAAGRAMANDDVKMYETFWKRRLRDYYQTAATNRWLYARLGDRCYNAVLRRFPDTGDVRDYLRRAYAPHLLKRLWYRLVLEHKQSAVLTVEEGCDCTWCRCRRHEMTTA